MAFRAICDNCNRIVLGLFSSFTKIDGKYLCSRCASDPTWVLEHRLTFKQRIILVWRWLRYGVAISMAVITFALLLNVFGVFESQPMTCNDGWMSPSIGIMGACSHHGGVKRTENIKPLLALVALFLSYLIFLFMLFLLRIKQVSNNESSRN